MKYTLWKMFETTVWNNIDMKKGNEVNTFNPKGGQNDPTFYTL